MDTRFRILALGAVLAATVFVPSVFAAGTLVPRGGAVGDSQPIRIRDHHVNVVINNGFARTEVTQTFHNPNAIDLEAIYSFPLPKSASLSEVTIEIDERIIEGEVVEKEEARTIYREEKEAGRDAGIAEKDTFKTFEFAVSRVPAGSDARIAFVYYQPITVDTGVGRYLYPLQEGGTDDVARSFWTTQDVVDESLVFDLEIKSAWPIEKIRVPGFENDALVDVKDDGHRRIHIERRPAKLDTDIVVYYRLRDDLPGRVEVIPFRDDPSKPGTFMMVVTPGLDLKPIQGGADYTFVLDVSGSMASKLATLCEGMGRVLGEMSPEDRFRIITFNNTARDMTGGRVAADEGSVRAAVDCVARLQSSGGTNLYAGLELALSDLDDDRATSIILVTDGVTNVGVTQGAAFHELMKTYDVRIFGFLMGNSANWPLMRTICQSSGGFSAGVSNADDIIGQLVLAKSKVVNECLHDAELAIDGVRVFDTSGLLPNKIFAGQQLIAFGRYAAGGPAKLTLRARMTGEDRTYTTRFTFPELDVANPEVERLWALSRIEDIEALENMGQLPSDEAHVAIRDLGIAYQLVTDHTSMVVLSDEAFAERGIERQNFERVNRERTAQTIRVTEAPENRRVDEKDPMFHGPAPSSGGNGGGGGGYGTGAIDPWTALAMLFVSGLGVITAVRRRPRGVF